MLVQPPSPAAREALARCSAKRVDLRYEWVRDWAAIHKLTAREDIELVDCQEWLSLLLV